MSLDLVRPKNSEDAPVADPEEQQMVDENSTGNPYGLFPELVRKLMFPRVWLKVSSKVEDLLDWLNLYSSSSRIMGLLQDEMYERIFPQVFSHLHKYLKRKDVINLCAADRKFETAIISWVQKRWLAPRWKGEQNGFTNYEKYFEDEISEYSPIVSIETREQIQLITNELFEGDSGSLIPFGIVFYDRREGIHFWATIKTFLQSFGTRIWFCKFISDIELMENPTLFLDQIIQCLKVIPNVIRLGLRIPFLTPPNHPQIFPHLAKLKVLSLVQPSHKVFMDFLRLHANQLESLSSRGVHAPKEPLRYSGLKMLRLIPLIPFKVPKAPLRLDLICQAPLTYIYTEVTAYGFAQFGRKFLLFNNFGESLEYLELQVDVYSRNNLDREENDMTWTVNINLPKLKKLTMWSDYGAGPHLLLRMHSFQDSHFPFPNHWLESEKENKHIFNSNIWSILSNLQEVKFCKWDQGTTSTSSTTGIYTREGYNQYCEDPLNFNF